MLKKGPDFHFEIVVIRNKRVRDNEVRMYIDGKCLGQLLCLHISAVGPEPSLYSFFSMNQIIL